jgi:DNA-binding phage protein
VKVKDPKTPAVKREAEEDWGALRGARLVMPAKTPITLKREITELLASGNFGSHALILDDKDVRLLLRAAIKREGSISAFARRHGLERSQLNNMLNERRPVSRVVLKALGLRKVYVAE